ncbi:hypothetical protein CSOJ01_03872 [Colletotrichum sojae]|uniref:Uncharacterized protein n=1 Tax=Colletotrichum sojae TaxID=2175907 RepID=A0A8H6N0D3_9PEZI|nr:hypothetical protein CSOJ01_03872 [Colletotrichum sojae]
MRSGWRSAATQQTSEGRPATEQSRLGSGAEVFSTPMKSVENARETKDTDGKECTQGTSRTRRRKSAGVGADGGGGSSARNFRGRDGAEIEKGERAASSSET